MRALGPHKCVGCPSKLHWPFVVSADEDGSLRGKMHVHWVMCCCWVGDVVDELEFAPHAAFRASALALR